MSFIEYFGPRRRQLRMKERVYVLLGIKIINDKRMRDVGKAEAEVKRRGLSAGEGSSTSGGGSGSSGDVIVSNQRRWSFSEEGHGFN